MIISWYLHEPALDSRVEHTVHLFDTEGEMPQIKQEVYINNLMTVAMRETWRNGEQRNLGSNTHDMRRFVVNSAVVSLSLHSQTIDNLKHEFRPAPDGDRWGQAEDWAKSNGMHVEGLILEHREIVLSKQRGEVVLKRFGER